MIPVASELGDGPQRRKLLDSTWIRNTLIGTLAPKPFRQLDWPAPIKAGKTFDSNWIRNVLPGYAVPAKPFTGQNWPDPLAKAKVWDSWIPNLLTTTLVTTTSRPFVVSDWPSLVRNAGKTWDWFPSNRNIFATPQASPFRLLDWSAPPGRAKLGEWTPYNFAITSVAPVVVVTPVTSVGGGGGTYLGEAKFRHARDWHHPLEKKKRLEEAYRLALELGTQADIQEAVALVKPYTLKDLAPKLIGLAPAPSQIAWAKIPNNKAEQLLEIEARLEEEEYTVMMLLHD